MGKFIICIAVLFISGCNVDRKPDGIPVDAATNNGMSGYMEEVFLKDGTRCVTWKSGYAGGMSCDWKH